jgi:hypothetical protein
MKALKLAILFFSIGLMISCDGDDQKGKKRSTSMLPPAQGNSSEIYVIMDSTLWLGDIGQMIKSVLAAPMDGLPQDEPIFSIKYVNPLRLNRVMRMNKNLIFVTLLDNQSRGNRELKKNFTEASWQKIEENPELFMLPKKDEFATGQHLLHLFGTNEQLFADNFEKNQARIKEYWWQIEKQRITENLFKKAEQKNISNLIKKDFSCEMKVPSGYELVMKEDDFIWFRRMDNVEDKSFFISFKTYESEEEFKAAAIVSWRDKIVGKYIYGDPDNENSYMRTVGLLPVVSKQVNFNGKFAIENRGLWETANKSMGGPFLSYVMVDEALNRIYYIEGFVFAPSKGKRDAVKEMEAALWTFKTSESPVALK